jgi:hypothetical protein
VKLRIDFVSFINSNACSSIINHLGENESPYFRFAILLFLIALIQACGLDIEDPTPPSPPQWVYKTLPEEWPERGIDAHESGGIILQWEANLLDEDIIVYMIYRSQDNSNEFQLLYSFNTDLGHELEYIDETVSYNSRFYYTIKAVDRSQNSSLYSDTLSFSILERVLLESMHPNGVNDTLSRSRQLYWSYRQRLDVQNFCITILREDNVLVIRRNLPPTNYVNGREMWLIPSEVILEQGTLYKWRIDTGANYTNGYESSGSESHWATFLSVDK